MVINKSDLPLLTLSHFQFTFMKHLRTQSLLASFYALTIPFAYAGMAPTEDALIDESVHEAIASVKHPTGKAQSTPTYPV